MPSVLRALGLIALIVLSACTQYSVPPRSTLTVPAAYQPLSVADAPLTVVIDTSRFVIDDEKAVAAHLGEAASPKQLIFALFSQSFASALSKEAPFGEIMILGPSAGIPPVLERAVQLTGLPPETRFVLFVDSLHQYRAKYPSYNPQNPFAERQAVRHDVDYRLWDVQRETVVAKGRVESEEAISLLPSSSTYVGAAEEMAEQLTESLGVRTKR